MKHDPTESSYARRRATAIREESLFTGMFVTLLAVAVVAVLVLLMFYGGV